MSFSTGRILGAACLVAVLSFPAVSSANHSVLIEGELDFDGDGLVGALEDNDDPTDRVFGTINGALAQANGGLNQNGKAIIVTSGRFPEIVLISGQVTLEAAPGVEAVVEAFLAGGDPRLADFPGDMMCGNDCRQANPGIIIDAPVNRQVVVRNIATRNWTDGVLVRGSSRVLLDNVRAEHNVDEGVDVIGTANVQIYRSSVSSTGFRVNPVSGDFPSAAFVPGSGIGIRFRGLSRGDITDSSSVGNFGLQISNEAQSIRSVQVTRVQTAGFSDDGLRLICRRASLTNLDGAEICIQGLSRLGLGIPDVPLTPGAPPFAISAP